MTVTNAQNTAAVPMKWTPSVPVDTNTSLGVNSIADTAARVHVTPALVEVRRMMRDIRSSGKCGIIVARWDGSAWCISKTEPPCRVNE
jgi:hypothetical protein